MADQTGLTALRARFQQLHDKADKVDKEIKDLENSTVITIGHNKVFFFWQDGIFLTIKDRTTNTDSVTFRYKEGIEELRDYLNKYFPPE